MALTDILCKTLKPKEKSYKKSDEKGLYLEVLPNGSKYWRMKYRFEGKEKRFAIGVYPEISLKQAREERDEARKLLREGKDPTKEKQDARKKDKTETQNLFENVAREWHESQKAGWTKRHASYVLKRLEADIFPNIGNVLISEIKPIQLLEVIKKIEARGATDIAKRALQTCGQIYRYAVIHEKAPYDITSGLRAGLAKSEKTKHRAAIKENELPEFLNKLKNYDGEPTTKLALKLLIQTFVRTNELIGAKWQEFDFDKKEWRIPASRMKMKEEHIVPLTDQAIAILDILKPITGKWEYVFASPTNARKPISNNTMLYAMYRMGYHSRATPHGFRATASTILNERGFRPDVIERQLAHAERNKVRAAYNRAEYLKERRDMMNWWSDYLDRAAVGGGNVFEGKFGNS